MTAPEPARTILVVAYPSGDWSVVSHDQSPENVAKLRTIAEARACCLVRYPLDAFRADGGWIDFRLAEEVG
jgi:hypothetical protein